MLTLLLSATGCSLTPGLRAQQRRAAFTALSKEDRCLVLHGNVRKGMDKDAVYIAWGKPGEKVEAGSKSAPSESWLYFLRWGVRAPMHAYADTPFAGNLFAARYERNVIFSGVRRRKAVFVNGKLSSSEVSWHFY